MVEFSQQQVERESLLGLPDISAEDVGGWVTAIILALLLLSFGWSLSAARWTKGLDVLQVILLGGVTVGILMARSRFDGVFPILHSLITGTAWVFYWVSTLIKGDLTAQERVYELLNRWYIWFVQAISGGTSNDSLIFTLELAFLCWWLAFLAGWAVFREQKVWRAILPVGIALIINAYYAGGLTGYLLFYCLMALLLLTRVNLGRYETWWRIANIRYAPDIHFDFMRYGFTFAIIVIVTAWVLPNIHGNWWVDHLLRPLERPWHSVQEEWQRLFTSLDYKSAGAPAGFNKMLTLSGHRNLGDTIVMEIRAEGADRWYWRVIAYDTYTGRGWVNTDEKSIPIAPNLPPDLPSYSMRKTVTQTVTLLVPGGNALVAASLPAGSSIPARAEVSFLPEVTYDIGLPPEAVDAVQRVKPVDISLMISRDSLKEGDSYTTRSYITTVDIESLRNAGDAYPSYITERYLQLPETLPERVRQLAEEITAPYDNAYDKAAALELYLREIEYNDDIPPPPPGMDGVDYFLFDIKAGYCDYYASAMAVMARAVGIPARIASGYAEGEWDEEAQVYRVRERDAHTWVEIYFPGYGWIEFEPTASLPRIERPTRRPDSQGEDRAQPFVRPEDEDPLMDDLRSPPEDDMGAMDATSSELRLSPWVIAAAAVISLLLAATVGFVLRPYLLTRESRLAGRLYENLLRWAGRLGIALSPAYTPYENASVIGAAIPKGHPHVLRITEAYVQEQFSPHPLPPEMQQEVWQSWRLIRPQLWGQWLRRRWSRRGGERGT
ncbi:MAG TPA: transglutaminase domain-containing protein [Caldilineae bacterium]|nr:transglutaminase domain-containing protein [Caldilineae bacterium]